MKENPPTDQSPGLVKNDTRRQLAKLNSPWFIWPTTGVLAVLLFFGLDYLVTAFTHESTDDAFITAHVVSIAPRVAGQVSTVHVLDNEMIHSNDLLVEIDPADYSTVAAQKQSSADAAQANYKTALAALDLMTVKVATAEATADQSKADADAVPSHTMRARRLIFSAARSCGKQNTISAQEFDAAQSVVREADANLAAAKQKAVADASRINEAKATQTATEASANMALALFRQAQADRAIGATRSFLHQNLCALRRARDAQNGRTRRLCPSRPGAS